MESFINQRIKIFLDDKQISLNALAKKLNMNQSTILRQVKGEQTLAAGVVEKFLLSFPEVSAEWLLRGIGTMKVNQIDTILKNEAPVVPEQESIWKAKYESIKECYDSLLASLGGIMGKRNVG